MNNSAALGSLLGGTTVSAGAVLQFTTGTVNPELITLNGVGSTNGIGAKRSTFNGEGPSDGVAASILKLHVQSRMPRCGKVGAFCIHIHSWPHRDSELICAEE